MKAIAELIAGLFAKFTDWLWKQRDAVAERLFYYSLGVDRRRALNEQELGKARQEHAKADSMTIDNFARLVDVCEKHKLEIPKFTFQIGQTPQKKLSD